MVVVGIAVAQQLCGIDCVMYYTPVILKRAGTKTFQQTLGVQAVMGVFKTLVIVLSAWLLDRPGSTGRRSLLLVSLPGCAFALLIMFVAFQGHSGSGEDVDPNLSLAIIGLFSYVFFFSIGIGPICWLFCAEILPLPIRAKGMSFATTLNRMTSAFTALTFLDLTRWLGDGGAFFFYAVITSLGALFAWWYVPETKGKTLEEMVKYFEEITGSRGGHTLLGDRLEPPDEESVLPDTKEKSSLAEGEEEPPGEGGDCVSPSAEWLIR